MKLVLTGGGTGGHICPLLGLAATARQADPDIELAFVGESTGLENRLVPAAGYPLHALRSRPLPRRVALRSVGALLRLAATLPRARSLLRELSPDAVIGTGGYASACVLYAATQLRLRTLLIELNAVPGRTTRFLRRRLTRVCLQFPEAVDRLPGAACEITGSPVRPEFRTADREACRAALDVAPEEFVVLVFGGSQGARSLNVAVQEALPLLCPNARPWRLLHLCGEEFLPTATQAATTVPADSPLSYRPEAYRDDLWELLAAADLVVSRAGGSSLSELGVVGTPALLVPYPYATDDHQTHNATHFVKAGAALMITDAELSGRRLARELASLEGAPERLAVFRQAMKQSGFAQAAETILALAGGGTVPPPSA